MKGIREQEKNTEVNFYGSVMAQVTALKVEKGKTKYWSIEGQGQRGVETPA